MAELVDISEVGCRIRLVVAVSIGSLLTIGVPDYTRIKGRVVSCKGQEIRVDFAHPLPTKVFDDLKRLASEQVIRPDGGSPYAANLMDFKQQR